MTATLSPVAAAVAGEVPMPHGYGVALVDGTTPRQVASVLERAASLLIRDGWCQVDEVSKSGRRCLLGAIARACVDLHPDRADRVNSDVLAEVTLTLSERHGWTDLPERWNDVVGRSVEDVLDVLAQTRTAVTG